MKYARLVVASVQLVQLRSIIIKIYAYQLKGFRIFGFTDLQIEKESSKKRKHYLVGVKG